MILLYLIALTPFLLLVAVVYFLVCLCRYLFARKYWKEVPCEETQWEKEYRGRKLLIISVILLVTLLVFAVLAVITANSLAYM